MKGFLLPHKVQRIALFVILAVLFVISTVIILSIVRDVPTSRVFQSLALIILYLAIICCVFSREKVEDEYISSLRLRSIAIVSIIALMTVVILNVVQVVQPYDKYLALKEWRKEAFWSGSFIIDLAVLYFLILKISIRFKR